MHDERLFTSDEIIVIEEQTRREKKRITFSTAGHNIPSQIHRSGSLEAGAIGAWIGCEMENFLNKCITYIDRQRHSRLEAIWSFHFTYPACVLTVGGNRSTWRKPIKTQAERKCSNMQKKVKGSLRLNYKKTKQRNKPHFSVLQSSHADSLSFICWFSDFCCTAEINGDVRQVHE